MAGPAAARHAGTDYRPDIDGLRAVAVLSVLGFHAFPYALPSGFIGVDIFFVISGYLITGIILSGLRSDSFSFYNFYAGRIVRIIPSLLVILAVCLTAGWFLLLNDEYAALGKHVAAAAVFILNFVFWQESGYFDASQLKPLLHLWSLAVEEQFYIIWPSLIFAASRSPRFSPVFVIALVTTVSFVVNVTLISHPVFNFFSPLTRFWELGIGAGLAFLRFRADRRTSNILSTAGALLLLVGLIATPEIGFPGWWALLPTIGSAAIIAARPDAGLNRILSMRPLVGIGLISYPLYLWHWPLLTFPRIVLGEQPSHYTRAGAVVLAILLAWGTYQFIEKPIRFGRWRRAKPMLAALLTGLAASGIVGLVVWKTDGLETVRSQMVADVTNVTAAFDWPYADTPRCNERYPFPEWTGIAFWFCGTNRDAPPSILILGNSYANDLLPGISEQMPEETVLSIGACYPIRGVTWENPGLVSNHPCTEANQLAHDQFIDGLIASNPTIRLAFLHAAWPYFDDNGEASDGGGVFIDRSGPPSTSREAFKAGVARRIEFLKSHNIHVVIVLPRPRLRYDIKTCFPRPLMTPQNDCSVEAAVQYENYDAVRRDLVALAESDDDVDIFDPYDAFCSNGLCNFVKDGEPLLRDDTGHLTKFGSELLVEKLLSELPLRKAAM